MFVCSRQSEQVVSIDDFTAVLGSNQFDVVARVGFKVVVQCVIEHEVFEVRPWYDSSPASA